jgi:hypothetical protein
MTAESVMFTSRQRERPPSSWLHPNVQRAAVYDPYHFRTTFPFSASIGGHTLLLKRHTTIAPATCGKSPFTRSSHLLSFQDALTAFGQRSLQS